MMNGSFVWILSANFQSRNGGVSSEGLVGGSVGGLGAGCPGSSSGRISISLKNRLLVMPMSPLTEAAASGPLIRTSESARTVTSSLRRIRSPLGDEVEIDERIDQVAEEHAAGHVEPARRTDCRRIAET